MADLSPEAQEQRRKYQREYYKNNPAKYREYAMRYWEGQAQKAREQKSTQK